MGGAASAGLNSALSEASVDDLRSAISAMGEEERKKLVESLALSTGDDDVWYFAIASMMNPVSMESRQLTPIKSVPCEILDHKLYFYGSSGLAEAIPEVGSSFHGVLHKMKKQDLKFLDGIEGDLTRAPCKCKLYDGTIIEGSVYTRPEAVRGADDKAPGQRYLEIMIEGCQHFGVKQEYIEFLKNHDNQPRTKLEHLSKLQLPAGLPEMTMDQVAAADGQGDNDLFVTLNGKVLKLVYPEGNSFRKIMVEKKAAGVHCFEIFSHAMAYDPKFGKPKGQEDISKEFAACIEDRTPMQVKYLGGSFEVVGTIALTYKD